MNWKFWKKKPASEPQPQPTRQENHIVTIVLDRELNVDIKFFPATIANDAEFKDAAQALSTFVYCINKGLLLPVMQRSLANMDAPTLSEKSLEILNHLLAEGEKNKKDRSRLVVRPTRTFSRGKKDKNDD